MGRLQGVADTLYIPLPAIGYANKYVRKTGNTSAEMHFWVDDPVNVREPDEKGVANERTGKSR